MADINPEDMPIGDIDEAAPPADRRARRKRWFGILALVLVATAVIWGIWFLLTQAGRVSTDNAYVGADTAQVTPLIAAPVAEVRVANTQAVKKGDVLVVLDPADARIEVAQAQSTLAQAEQKYNQARANVGAARGRMEARGSEID
jgi:membrane fusion protein (multidrug efflux system)